MEFKKCERCGSFFVSNENVCSKCAPKDKLEMYKLKNYFETDNYSNSISSISVETGISIKNLNRYMESAEFSNKLNEKIEL